MHGSLYCLGTNTCVESGQNVELTLDANAGRTYRYAILVEGNTQVVESEHVAHV